MHATVENSLSKVLIKRLRETSNKIHSKFIHSPHPTLLYLFELIQFMELLIIKDMFVIIKMFMSVVNKLT